MISLFSGSFQIPYQGPLFIEGLPNTGKTPLAEGIWYELKKMDILTDLYSGVTEVRTEDELVRAMIKAHKNKVQVLLIDGIPSEILFPTPQRNIKQDLMDACIRLNISLVLLMKTSTRQNPYSSYLLIPRENSGVLANVHRHEFFEFKWKKAELLEENQDFFSFSKVCPGYRS